MTSDAGAAPKLDLTKLARILGMLGSEHDGERASAARKASEMIKAAGVTWEQVLIRPPVARSAQPRKSSAYGMTDEEFAQVVRTAQAHAARDSDARRARERYEQAARQARQQKPGVYDWPFNRKR